MGDRLLLWAGALPLAIILAAACGSSDQSLFGDGLGDAGEGGGGDALPGDEGGLGGDGASFGDVTTLDDAFAACATDTQRGKQLPLDLAVMLDTSGSMFEPVTTGGTKYESVKTAMGQFVNDPGSAGIGIALQYFPL